MLHEEAQAEADRRNNEDPDRERFEFYPFDESAGMAADAWDVAARLRQGPSTQRPATAAGAAHPREAVSRPPPQPAAPDAAPPETVAHETIAPAYEEPVAYPEAEPEPYVHPEPLEAPDAWEHDDRPGFFVRLVGLVVVFVGVTWLAIVVALALILSPDNATSFAIYLGAAALGFLAMALGVVIRRS
ncbi:MAG: hypothetical protein QOE65_1334 [Solirubrobacteraceae bacterium]|jgi:hypothetical protein|nr:hypothetical protein [Solirubrobacteraceae bacterium]